MNDRTRAQSPGESSARPVHEPEARPALTVRIALWSARHRWPVLLAWFALTFGLLGVSMALGGIRSDSPIGGGRVPQTESGRALAAMNPGGSAASSEELDVVITGVSTKATDPAFRTVVETVVERLGAVRATVGGIAGPALSELADPYAAPATAGYVAPDNTSVRIVGRIDGDAATIETRVRALAPVIASVQGDYTAFEIHAYNNTLLADQMTEEINRDMDGSMALSLPLTFLILLLAFGALVAAGVPLLFAVSALCAAFGIFGIFSQTVEPVSPFAAQFIVLIGLAVAVDYSLFMITRFRSVRRAGQDRLTAIEVASATSGRAVLFSGMAVMISLAGLFLLPDPLFQSIAIGAIVVILVSVVGSLVFLPAVLAILGDRVDRGRMPFVRRNGHGGDANTPGRGVWTPIVRSVMRHPVAAMVVATIALMALASPATRLHLGEMDTSVLPSNLDGVKAVEALQTHWPGGTLLRLNVVVTEADEHSKQEASDRLGSALVTIPGLSGPALVSTSPGGSAASISVVMSGSANDPANWEIVRRVRSNVVPETIGGLAGVTAYVGGDAATAMDQTQIYTGGMGRVFLFVLGFSFVLLLLVFHSIAIPIKAILMNLLATGAAFGALVLVFQEGWFASLLGVRPTSVVQDWVPIFIFTILFGLSMDYEVFILSRIKEAFDGGADSHDAVERGITLTAGTVTSAATIMVVVFGIFLTLPLTIARELGLGLAVAVFVDATLIRCVLLPATMRLLGDWNWWLPPFLRWLPRITIEGECPDPGVAAGAGVAADARAAGAGAPGAGAAGVSLAGASILPSGTGARPR